MSQHALNGCYKLYVLRQCSGLNENHKESWAHYTNIYYGIAFHILKLKIKNLKLD